jgi:hypothetical protein
MALFMILIGVLPLAQGELLLPLYLPVDYVKDFFQFIFKLVVPKTQDRLRFRD